MFFLNFAALFIHFIMMCVCHFFVKHYLLTYLIAYLLACLLSFSIISVVLHIIQHRCCVLLSRVVFCCKLNNEKNDKICVWPTFTEVIAKLKQGEHCFWTTLCKAYVNKTVVTGLR